MPPPDKKNIKDVRTEMQEVVKVTKRLETHASKVVNLIDAADQAMVELDQQAQG